MTLSDFVCHARLINEITLRITNNYGLVSHWELVSLLLNILSNAFEKLSLSSKLLYRVRGQYLNHLYTIKKWHVQQERIQIAESITPTAHLMNSSPTWSSNIFKTKMN